MKRPLTGLAVAYASGIWVGSLVHWPAEMFLYIAAGLLAAFLLLYRTRFSIVALVMLVFASGAWAFRGAVTISSPRHIVRLLGLRDQNAVLRGVIVSDTGYREWSVEEKAPDRRRFELKVTAVQRAGRWEAAEGRVLVFVSEARAQEPLRYGDEVDCSVLLRVPPRARNPGAFDWRRWLQQRGIHFTATIRKKDYCTVRARDQGNPVLALSLRLRERFERALHFGLEDEPKLASVLAGMIIGERSEIPPETYANFQRTGVFHIFSVSGLNVALVTAVVVLALRLVRIPRRWCGLAAIPLLIVYVYATGARPGAVRALVMACVWLIGWMLVRPSDALNNLAAAALAILVCDPPQLFDGGFVLSFTVVAALVTLTPPIQERLNRLVAPDPLLPQRLLPRWRTLVYELWKWLVVALSASLAAWVGLLPLMAWYFNLFTPISILANVLVIPLLGSITALGMMAMPAHALWPWLTLTFNNANFFLLGLMIRGVEWLGSLPGGYQFVQAPPLWLVWAFYGAGVLLLAKRISWRCKRWTAALAVAVLGAALVFGGRHETAIEITVLDLNDGVSIFLNLPGQRHDVLIDGGSDWSGRRVVVPFLRAQGVDRLSAVVLTRADKAHAAGLSVLADEIPVGRAMHSGIASRSKFYGQWLEAMRRNDVPLVALRAGDRSELHDGCVVRVLHPLRGVSSNRSEDNAVVLALEFGPTRVLLMSDAGETVEKRLLKSGGDLRAAVIIKGRHGSERSCTDEFLDAVRPEVVVQVAGVRPSNRYPQPDLRERLAQRGVTMYRTDESGAVTIRLTQRGYTIRTCLGAR